MADKKTLTVKLVRSVAGTRVSSSTRVLPSLRRPRPRTVAR